MKKNDLIHTTNFAISILFLSFICLFVSGNPLWGAGKAIVTSVYPEWLTDQERAWLTKHPEIVLAPDPDFSPVDFFGDGSYQGISRDMLDLIEQDMGIRFKYLKLDTWDDVLYAVRTREVDGIPAAARTSEREKYLLFTHPHIMFSGVIVTRQDVDPPIKVCDLQGMRVAVVKGYFWQTLIAQDYPKIPLDMVHDVRTGLRRVSLGSSDAMIVSLPVAIYFTEKEGITNLQVSGDSGYFKHLSIATRSDWPILNTIIKKALARIPNETKAAVRHKWIRLEIGEKKLIDQWWFKALFIVIPLVSCLSLLLILWWNRSLKMQVRSRTEKLLQELAERRRVEQALRASEEKYRGVVDNALESIIVVQDGMIKYCNPETETVSGIDAKVLTSKPFIEFFHPDYRDAVMKRHVRRLAGEEFELENTFQIVSGDGQPRWVEIRPVRILWENRPAILNFMNDITEKKEADEKAKLAHDQLEKIVEERTIDYKNAMEEAEKANRLKSEFLANISHELRTPMHSILNFSKFGTDKFDRITEDKKRHYFRQIRKAGDRLMGLLNDLLDISKLEAGKANFKIESVNLWVVAKEAIEELQPIAREKQVMVNLPDPNVQTKIRCDEYKMGQVIRNLLSNAIKYSPANSRIEILFAGNHLFAEESEIPALEMAIRDQGVGIPVDELEYIFDKFNQSSRTNTGAGGTGLGLAICREIITAHQGIIFAENNPEIGATFRCLLPYHLNLP